MKFELFLDKIHQASDLELPGLASHRKMAPLERELLLQTIDFENLNPKIAAVLMLLYPKNGMTHLALIKRASFGVHSSQIAFPGGKYELHDFDYQQTALRETEEEIGIFVHHIEVIRALTKTFIPPSNFLVHPYLGIAKFELEFILQEEEVAGIIEMPIEILLNDSNMITQQIDTSYANFVNVPAFQFNEHIVWGATAMMLSELKDVLKIIF